MNCTHCDRLVQTTVTGTATSLRIHAPYDLLSPHHPYHVHFCSADCLMRWLCTRESWTVNDDGLTRVPRA